jgi:hypothetical protein
MLTMKVLERGGATMRKGTRAGDRGRKRLMRDQIGDTYALGFRAVQDQAPDASGIYAIFTPRRWLHIGETDDIRRSLLDHLNDELAESGPLSFSFEVVPPAGRNARRRALIAQLAPGLADNNH